MNWNWDHVRFFLALAQKKTLTAAARELGVSHSTVLRRIRQLETQLNTQLFDHTQSGYRLTAAGQTLFSEASKMQSTMSALSREISGADNHMGGEVVITTTDTLARHILPKIITQLCDTFSETNFSLKMANNISDMDDREVDIAIRSGKQPADDLIGRKVADIGFVVVAAQSYIERHALSSFPENSTEHSMITLDESYSAAPFYQWMHQHIDSKTRITTVNNFLCAAALAREGLGITVVPEYMLDKEPNLIELKTNDTITRNDLWVLSHPESRNTKRVRAVCQFLYTALAQRLAH